jgi:hypothetical protein
MTFRAGMLVDCLLLVSGVGGFNLSQLERRHRSHDTPRKFSDWDRPESQESSSKRGKVHRSHWEQVDSWEEWELFGDTSDVRPSFPGKPGAFLRGQTQCQTLFSGQAGYLEEVHDVQARHAG